MIRYRYYRIAAVFLAFSLVFSTPVVVHADTRDERIATHQAQPIQSNETPGWPQGPVVSADSAILIEAQSGTILYAKNIHKQQYPASTTKILTALLAYENSNLSDIVTFSKDAVFGIPRNSNHIAMDVGDTLSMEDCINALLIRSANEVAYAMAEKVGGSWSGFADMMNRRAKELGAVDSNFVNPNGLPDEDHVTSAYDLAMIGRAFFSYDTLCKITLSSKLVVPKEEEDLVEWNQMPLIPSSKTAYPYLVGCKTGYTDTAHRTFVACAEKNGMRLICVVLNDENPEFIDDTIALFEYGFNNFDKVNVSQSETKYNIDSIGFFYNDSGIFGTSQPILCLNTQDCVVLPKTASFSDLQSSISYDNVGPGQAALITYSYHNTPVGSVSLDLVSKTHSAFTFETEQSEDTENAATLSSASVEQNSEDSSQISEGNHNKPASKTAGSDNEDQKSPPSFVFISPSFIKALLIILITGSILFAVYLFLHRNFQFSFIQRFRRPGSRTAYQRDLQNIKNLKRERRAQIRAAKKRYKQRIKRR